MSKVCNVSVYRDLSHSSNEGVISPNTFMPIPGEVLRNQNRYKIIEVYYAQILRCLPYGVVTMKSYYLKLDNPPSISSTFKSSK